MSSAKKSKLKINNYLKYFFALLLLSLFTLMIASAFMLSVEKAGVVINTALIIIYALLSGFFSAKIIEGVTHKDKKEILAGSIIPLPAIICITIYLTTLDVIDPLVAGMMFFVCFNIPFLIILYEHEKHKHHLAAYLPAPLILALAYLFTYYISSYLAADTITPQAIGSFTKDYEIMPVKNYVENCMKVVAKDAVAKDIDVKLYVDENLGYCIDSFSSFDALDIESGNFTSSVSYNDKTITVSLYYPLIFNQGNSRYSLSDFKITMER